MRLWMEQKMNGKMRSAFIKRRLYARRCVGLWHRRERRSQRARWRGEGVVFLCSRERPPGTPALPRAGFAQISLALAVGAAPAAPTRPAPLGHCPRSGYPEGPATVPRRGGSQGPDARRPGPGQGQGDPHRPLYKETLRSRACRYRPERGHEGRKGSRRDQNAPLFKRKQKKLP